ncbi:MAG: hypothetical protein IT177_15525 [Acidobacteria bacterium]|nr:hypothetical protein [Acidobacteriota bacterium]
MIDRDAYCRELEAYLCRKNDGHLIRIVGPAFERVMGWADQGVPVKVAEAGIDRYFQRYYKKGPRRRPVRIEFCEADVLDAFDEWRRAVGVSLVAAEDPEGGPPVEEPAAAPPRPRRSLKSHLDSLMARLTVLRGSDKLHGIHDDALDRAIRGIEPLRLRAEQARGDERQAIVQALDAIGTELLHAIAQAAPAPERENLTAEAARELEPFRGRMPADAYRQAREAALARLVRLRYGLPDFSF